MKLIFAILLSLSLYTPSLVKMVAYADCTIQLLANVDPLFCDCSKVNYFSQIPFSPEGKDYTLSINTDWKYLSIDLSIVPQPIQVQATKLHMPFTIFIPSVPTNLVFRPPAV